MKKRAVALLLCFILTVFMCSCGRYASVRVNGEKISQGIYNYFLDRAKAENADASQTEQTEIANKKLADYVAVNSEFQNRGLKLGTEDKISLSDNVDALWHAYGEYYTKNKITKQDLYKIELSNTYRQALMLSIYSADGAKPVSEDELKNYFNSHYIAFKAITGFLTTVDDNNNAVAMSDAEKQNIMSKFSKMVEDINDGSVSFDGASTYADNVTLTSNAIVIDADDKSYPKGFYEQLSSMEEGRAASFVIGDYIFTVQRFAALSEDLNLFERYRTKCLTALKGEEFAETVSEWGKAYTVA